MLPRRGESDWGSEIDAKLDVDQSCSVYVNERLIEIARVISIDSSAERTVPRNRKLAGRLSFTTCRRLFVSGHVQEPNSKSGEFRASPSSNY